MKSLERIIRSHLKKAQKRYNEHLADKHSLNGPFLIGKMQSLVEVLKEWETPHAKTKAKKNSR